MSYSLRYRVTAFVQVHDLLILVATCMCEMLQVLSGMAKGYEIMQQLSYSTIGTLSLSLYYIFLTIVLRAFLHVLIRKIYRKWFGCPLQH